MYIYIYIYGEILSVLMNIIYIEVIWWTKGSLTHKLHVCGIAGNVAGIIMHIMCNYGFILASWTVCAYLAYLLQLNTVVRMGKTDTTQGI